MYHQERTRRLIQESRSHIWDEPYLFWVCSDGLLRRCVTTKEGWKIIDKCHSSPYGGHYGAFRTHSKIWQCGFYWPTMYEDTKQYIRRCGPCQRHRNINIRDAMPLTNNLQIELLDVWGIDYMGPFPPSKKCEFILVAVDYVSKWGRGTTMQACRQLQFKEDVWRNHISKIWSPQSSDKWSRITFHRQTVRALSIKTWNPSQRRYPLSSSDKWTSRDFQQTNQEYSSKDSKWNGNDLDW